MKRIFTCLSFFIICSFADAASFDCAKASNRIENAICSDAELSSLDSQLMQSYKKSLSESANADSVKSEQRAWLKVRNKCQDASCLKQAYLERIAALGSATTTTPTSETIATPAEASPSASEMASTQFKTESDSAPLEPHATASSKSSSTDAIEQSERKHSDIFTSEEKIGGGQSVAGTAEIFVKVLGGIILVLMILFVIGLINPKWILQWKQDANRKKLAGYFFVVVAPIWLLNWAIQQELVNKDASKSGAGKGLQIALGNQEGIDKKKDVSKPDQSSESDIPRTELKDICRLSGISVTTALEKLERGGDVDPKTMAEELVSRANISQANIAKAKVMWVNSLTTAISEREKYLQQLHDKGAPDFNMAMNEACQAQYIKPDPKADEEEMQAWRRDMEIKEAEARRQEANRPKPLWQRYYMAINANGYQCEQFKFVIKNWSESGFEENQLNQMAGNVFAQARQAGCVQ